MAAKKPVTLAGHDVNERVAIQYKDGSYTEFSLAKWGELVDDLIEDFGYDGEVPKNLKVAFIPESAWKTLKVTTSVEVVE